MSYLEKDFQMDWNRWVMTSEGKKWARRVKSSACELKYSQGPPIPFTAVKPHQVQGLMDVKYDVKTWKLSDIDIRQKPFDSLVLTGMNAYVILGYHPNKHSAYLIDVDDWVRELATSKRKSITKQRAQQIAEYVIEI